MLAAAAIAVAGAAAAQPSAAPAPRPPAPAAAPESGLKNMQVLTGLFDVLPTMHVMRAALGVTCDYCHVAENGQYWRDDKPAKQRARQMIRMVDEINRANFDGRTEVTCNSCHRGSTRPVAVPAIGQALTFDTTHAEPAAPGPPPPTAAQVLETYLDAIGGRRRLEAVKTRAVRMTVLRSAPVEATPAQVANRGQAQLVETLQQAPDRYAYTRTTPAGAVSTLVLAGDGGWMRTSQAVQSMNPAQAEQVRGEWRAGLDLGRELDWAKRLGTTRPARRDAIDGRPVWVVAGAAPAPAGASERLYFDARTGLLLRRTVLRPTQVGPDPEQTDYADYRAVDGVLLPFRITTSYLDDNHLGVTRIVASVKENVEADSKAFEPPPDRPR